MDEESLLQNHQQSAEVLQLRDSADSTNLISMLAGGGCGHHHCNSPCAATACNGSSCSNSLKRRPPAYSSGSGDRSAKKLFCDQEDLNLHGFSAVSLPISLGRVDGKGSAGRQCCPVLRRCVSDAYKAPWLDAAAEELPECATASGGRGNPVTTTPPPAASGCGLPPRPPPSLRRTVSSPAKALSRALSSEETPPDSSMKLRRMKDRMKEMKQWWDEVLEDGEEVKEEKEEEKVEANEEKKVQVKEGGGGELDEFAVAEEDKVPPPDELGGDSEEAISVEWVKQCLSLTFRCPCGKGYEVLLNENNCYYRLV